MQIFAIFYFYFESDEIIIDATTASPGHSPYAALSLNPLATDMLNLGMIINPRIVAWRSSHRTLENHCRATILTPRQHPLNLTGRPRRSTPAGAITLILRLHRQARHIPRHAVADPIDEAGDGGQEKLTVLRV